VPTSVSESFIKLFESEVKLAYQQMASKCRQCVRLKSGVTGSTVQFPKLAKGIAQQKARHGEVPLMNAVHTYATATLGDWYAPDYVDKLDELKTNSDERGVLTQTGAMALGRKVDNIIFTAARLSLASAQRIQTSGGLTKAKAQNAFKILNDKDVPDDGQRYAFVGPQQWNNLLDITEFASSDFIGPGSMPWTAGTQAKKWLNTVWAMHTGLPTDSTDATRYCLMWHKTAIGMGEGIGVTSMIDWVPERAAYLIDNMVSSGAVAIDGEGIVQIDCNDTA
jgi:hypothetical protein